ncbi:hypothetical protein Gasu2_19650 [Galdieria sulphuraria]|uniref:Uncharacterized protein n=1 Tax=Galdieria sulphuraria TaxID=130081 RepID=M2Y5G1_GALSU|nr:uncharacterized protein Gasu_14500 [Galdieria sulphuraria]EME31203.1 hypothetical protein Gasu_14500 [Galdieria sulphuraria]GJD07614.1 hypothetical protein Gasu2_19650 [Galdieria sulphuraria]|eukprot:XP_005707723.1 hypothetical protein Gasu_14500 [Galdieria sulphuraria]
MDPVKVVEEQFQRHDFDSDERWKVFRDNALTTGSEEHLKRVYFRRYVNHELPLRNSQTAQNNQETLSTSSSPDTPDSSSAGPSLNWRSVVNYARSLFSRDFVQHMRRFTSSNSLPRAISTLLCLLQLLTIWKAFLFLLDQNKKNFLAAFQFAFFANICSLLQVVGVPQISRQWFQSLVYHEDFAFILYCFVQRSITPPSTVSLIPIACRATVSACELLSTLLPSITPTLYYSLADLFQFILHSRDTIYLLSAITEIILFPVILFRSIQVPQNLFSLFPYSFFLRLRFNFSSHAQLAWRIVDSRLEPLVQNYMPLSWRPYYYRLKNFVRGLSRLR